MITLAAGARLRRGTISGSVYDAIQKPLQPGIFHGGDEGKEFS